MGVTHSYVATRPPDGESDIGSAQWNAEHTLDGVSLYTGFPRGADGTPQVTLSYADRAVTVTAKSGSTFDYYLRGEKITLASPYVFAAHATDTGGYFFYFDSAGDETVGTDAWSILKDVPVCYVYFDAGQNKGVAFNELHSATRNPDLHERLHYVDGAQAASGFAITGYTPQGNTDGENSFSVAAGDIRDEDLLTTTSALSEGGPYTVWYRTTGGAWTWDEAPTLPFLHNGSTNKLRWNEYTTDWTLADTETGDFVNYWVYALPALTAGYQIALVMGQALHETLAAAQNENAASISWGALPWQEAAPLYRVTWRVSTGYATTGDCRIEAVDRIQGTRASLSVSGIIPPSFGAVSDGTNTASAEVAGDTLKLRSANALLTISVSDDDPTHGDSVLFTVDAAASNHTHAQLHDAVTVADSTSIDLTLTGQQISAAAIFGTGAGTVCQGNDARLTDARTPTSHDHASNKLAQANTHESADTDSATSSLHHTIGTGATQAAAGNHSHAQLHDRSHAITSTSDHTAGNWKVFHSNGSGELVELALGADGTYLKSNGASAAPSFASPSGTGDVTGPSSSVDSEIALFSSTTGKVIKRATTTGILKASSGVIAAATAGTDYPRPYVAVATLAGDQATGANTTPVTLTGLSWSFEANAVYFFEWRGDVSPGANTTGCGFQIDVSAAVTQISMIFFHQLANTGTLSGGHSIADDASVGVSSGMPATSTYPVSGTGMLRTGANTGTAQLRFRSETTAATTAKAGMTLVVRRVA